MVKQRAESKANDINLITMSGSCSDATAYNMTGGTALDCSWLNPVVLIPSSEKSLPFTNEWRKKGVGMVSSTHGAFGGRWILKAAVDEVRNTIRM